MIACAISRFLNGTCPKGSNSNIETVELLVSKDIHELQEEWISLGITDIYFQLPYLTVMQNNGSDHVVNYYVVMKSQGKPIAGFLFQLSDFNFEDKIKSDSISSSTVQQFLNKKLNYKVLVHGNLYLSGNHINYFTDNTLTENEKADYILDIMDELSQYIAEEGIKVEALLIKDKDSGSLTNNYLKEEARFSNFCVDPNMILLINKDWKTIEDYTVPLKSKYRVRYRKARSLRSSIILKELSYDDMVLYQKDIYKLYKKTATDAEFNFSLLGKSYFQNLKEALTDNYIVYGYFDNEKLIGFYTAVKNETTYSAHYLGFDDKYNVSHKLYLNILYDLIEHGIQSNTTEIHFSRTALEIKSTVGAVAVDLQCYIKLDSRIKNRLLPHLLTKIVPKKDWIQRSPFKKDSL